MAKKHTNQSNIDAMQKKQRKQAQVIESYKNETKWVTGAGLAILVFAILSLFTVGFASNWWQTPTAASQFTPIADTSGGTNLQTPTSSTGSTGSNSSSNGTRSTGTNTNASDATHSTSSTNTTTNNTTTASTPTSVPGDLLTLYSDSGLGKSVDTVISQADSLGILHNCHVEILAVQVCEFTLNGSSFTTKNLITGSGITGLTSLL